MKITYLLVGISVMFVVCTVQADDSIAAKAKKMCSTCHSATSDEINPIYPTLAGQPKDYLVAQLNNIKNHTRQNKSTQDHMWKVADKLDDQTMNDLAEYFSKQKPVPGERESASLLAKGQNIFEKGIESKSVVACAGCHGAQGEGMASFPRLAGQHRFYIAEQMKAFHDKQRPGWQIMQPIADKLSSEDIEAVSAYLQSK